jgi:aryl-alcohol dehydrogenase-like predicted oxidoreductase
VEYRQLGRTGLEVSALGFGCGAVGGLLVKGDQEDMRRVVARAIELGINYFDTARIYGDGKSEANLGLVLEELGADVVVGTKVRLRAEEMGDIEPAVIASVEGSLERLRMERVDLVQLHNPVALERQPDRAWVSVADVESAIRAFQMLQQQGRVRHWGINGLGETEAVQEVVASRQAETIQCCFNLLNPSAGLPVPDGFPFQNYGGLINKAAAMGMGVMAIRVLAAGALSGSTARHPNAAQSVAPIATSPTYAEDVALAEHFSSLVREGYANSLVETAIRFAMGKPEVSTALVGISNMEQLEQAVAYANEGPLPAAALHRIRTVWSAEVPEDEARRT